MMVGTCENSRVPFLYVRIFNVTDFALQFI